MYCTPAQLADAKLALELAEVATPDRMGLPPEAVMDAVLRGTDTSGYDADDVAAAQAALVVIEKAVADASGVIDGYLRVRKPVPYTVPLNPVPDIVQVWTRWIARYLLHKDRVNTEEKTDPVVRDYKEAIRFLEQIRDGKFALGANDPLPPPSGGMPMTTGPDRTFSADTLRDF